MPLYERWIAQLSSQRFDEINNTLWNRFCYGAHLHSNAQMYLHCTFLSLRNLLTQWQWYLPLGVFTRTSVPSRILPRDFSSLPVPKPVPNLYQVVPKLLNSTAVPSPLPPWTRNTRNKA
jgi:hypothetical protein